MRLFVGPTTAAEALGAGRSLPAGMGDAGKLTLTGSTGVDDALPDTQASLSLKSGLIPCVTHNAPTADLHYFQIALSLHGDVLQW